MKRALLIPLVLTVGLLPAGFAQEAKTILDRSGIRGGLVVHLGCGDGELTGALGASERYQVHGLASSAADVAARIRWIDEALVRGRTLPRRASMAE